MALAACAPMPKEAFFDRGHPESLLDVSSEVINFKLASPATVQEITDTLNKEQPTRATVNCQERSSLCKEVKSVMHQFKVDVKYHPSNANTVSLVYERTQARNCQNRYIDRTWNPYNLNSPTMGCSVAINTVQMVSDKHQFTDPALMDAPDANKGLQAIGNYDITTKPDTTFSPMVEGTSTASR